MRMGAVQHRAVPCRAVPYGAGPSISSPSNGVTSEHAMKSTIKA